MLCVVENLMLLIFLLSVICGELLLVNVFVIFSLFLNVCWMYCV